MPALVSTLSSRMYEFLVPIQWIDSAFPLILLFLQGTPDARFYGHPHSLLLFGRFLLKAHISRARGRGLRARELPLIISAPSAHRPSRCLLLGLPPVAVDTPKKYDFFVYFMYLHVFYLNFFNFSLMGKAFEQAAENTQTEITSVFFDSSGTRFVYYERNLNTYCRFYLQLLRSIPRIGAVS